MAAAGAGARSPQQDGGRVDRRAAVEVALPPQRAEQAAPAQAVRLRDVARVPGRVVGDPAGNPTVT